LYFFFGRTRVWSQGLVLAKQIFYFLSHTLNFFCFSYFSNRALCLCLGQCGPQSSCAHSPYCWDGMHVLLCPATVWDGVSLTFCQGLLGTMTLLMASSQVARITGVSHVTSFSILLISCRCESCQWKDLAFSKCSVKMGQMNEIETSKQKNMQRIKETKM
jgi:hypothetical protein